MLNISDYENAKAKYFNALALKTSSILSMSFHEEFLGSIKKSFNEASLKVKDFSVFAYNKIKPN